VLTLHEHDDVTRIQMSSWGSRRAGLDVSAYLVRGILIDTGFPRVWPELRRALEARAPRAVIVTHWHEDHAGNVAPLAAQGVPLLLDARTEATLRERPDILPYRSVVWGRPDVLSAPIARLEDTSDLEFVATPGHSDDHHVVWDPGTRTLFSGDLWLGVRARIFHEHEDPYRIVQSLRHMLSLGPMRMFDAHRGLVSDPPDAIGAKIEWMTETIGTIERRIAEGWSNRAIVRGVLGGEALTGWVSQREYARLNFVRAVRLKAKRA
jgi:glyoxylase-like metal-dependent hydrolase (beta-lactamase superfamily II)